MDTRLKTSTTASSQPNFRTERDPDFIRARNAANLRLAYSLSQIYHRKNKFLDQPPPSSVIERHHVVRARKRQERRLLTRDSRISRTSRSQVGENNIEEVNYMRYGMDPPLSPFYERNTPLSVQEEDNQIVQHRYSAHNSQPAPLYSALSHSRPATKRTSNHQHTHEHQTLPDHSLLHIDNTDFKYDDKHGQQHSRHPLITASGAQNPRLTPLPRLAIFTDVYRARLDQKGGFDRQDKK